MSEKRLFTSESVTEGHPDKIADQISDSVLDAVLSQDANAKVACETLVTTGLAFIAGEITTTAYVDIPTLARGVIREIGYTDAAFGFDCDTCSVITSIDEQSPDIAMGVVGKEGAGDQGMMFGFACRDTDALMPAPIFLAHRMSERLAWVRRHDSSCAYLRPDGKTQVTVEYVDNKPHRIDTVVVSTQHAPDVDAATIKKDMLEKVVRPVLAQNGFAEDGYTLHVNPTGRFVEGGPKADCGLTGRKIIVDTYGGMGSHGGAFSGKDPSKVDRSASYAARHIAKNIVAAELARECEIQIAYAIGEKEPVSVMVDTFGTGTMPDEKLTRIVRDVFDLTPKGIIERLKLRRGIYRKTAAYGHFGRDDKDFTWELTDYVEQLRKRA